jgi:pimeloyl-ACP methyl ester carboxylesterase
VSADNGVQDWGERAERWTGVRTEVMEVRGTAVTTLRAGDDADGTPQLLVHGLGGSATNWIEVATPLAAHGPVLAPDLPGFGRTEPPRKGASNVRTNARFLVALLDELGWDEVVVHGNSMGGLISVLLAELLPRRIRRLVLVSPALPTARRELRALDRRTFTRFAPFAVPGVGTPVLRRIWSSLTPEQLYRDMEAFVHADPTRVAPEIHELGIENIAFGRDADWRLPGFVAAAESLVALLLSGRELRRAMDAVRAPTLFVWGDQDALVGRPVVDHAVTRRDDWELAVLPGVGHVPMIEAPQHYLDVVTRWYAGERHEPDLARIA